MIFLSHTHVDKVVVQPIAEALAEEYGREKVFYDSWSIRPGDGIIDRMSAGLGETSFFIFFVSDAALTSGMVSLEWQNALMTAAKGKLRFIPVRLDRAELPAVLRQTRYVDMYENGFALALKEIKTAIAGASSYEPTGPAFENLKVQASQSGDTVEITVSATRHIEPVLRFFVLAANDKDQIDVNAVSEGSFHEGFFPGLASAGGSPLNGFLVQLTRPLTPEFPLKIVVNRKGSTPVQIGGVARSQGTGKPLVILPIHAP
jgi:hypothetical protein